MTLPAALPPRWPDPLVFGPPLPGGAAERLVLYGGTLRDCPRCGVSWRGDGGCWACGAAT